MLPVHTVNSIVRYITEARDPKVPKQGTIKAQTSKINAKKLCLDFLFRITCCGWVTP